MNNIWNRWPRWQPLPWTNMTSLLLDFWKASKGQEGINDERFTSWGVLLNNEEMKENAAAMCPNWWADEPGVPPWEAGRNRIYWRDNCFRSALVPPVPGIYRKSRTQGHTCVTCLGKRYAIFVFLWSPIVLEIINNSGRRNPDLFLKLMLYHRVPDIKFGHCLVFKKIRNDWDATKKIFHSWKKPGHLQFPFCRVMQNFGASTNHTMSGVISLLFTIMKTQKTVICKLISFLFESGRRGAHAAWWKLISILAVFGFIHFQGVVFFNIYNIQGWPKKVSQLSN